MKQLLYYANGGSGNHGCEAIIRSLEHILKPDIKSINLTISKEQDVNYSISDLVQLEDVTSVNRINVEFLKAYLSLKLRKSVYAMDLLPYKNILKTIKQPNNTIALSIGGDNYCYGGTEFYYELDNVFHSYGFKTALIGCSIEPEIVRDSKIRSDLASHKLVITRESITYEAMCNEGLTNVVLLPDPAFVLKSKELDLPVGFEPGNTIGINLSPMVCKYSSSGNLLVRNADKLIQHIIGKTDLQIALIPHVVWPQSNDLDTLRPLYEKYKDTGRVLMVEDCNAEELKGFISRCRFLIAARTHASIAAYSSCVPTLVIGYSVKAKGIAKDIFGTYENYVLPAQSFENDTDLIHGFKWLYENENTIRKHLCAFMPEYCKKAYQIKEEIERIC